MPSREYHRILLVGSAGAGKSTLAARLGELTGLPVHHLDRLHWRPGWVEPDDDVWRAQVRELVAGERWIIDGNYGATMHLPLARADAVVFLDLPRWRCVWRVVRRSWRYEGRTRPDLAAGCPERWPPDADFLEWVWNYPRRSRPRTIRRIAEHCLGDVITLRSPRDVERFVAAFASSAPRV